MDFPSHPGEKSLATFSFLNVKVPIAIIARWKGIKTRNKMMYVAKPTAITALLYNLPVYFKNGALYEKIAEDKKNSKLNWLNRFVLKSYKAISVKIVSNFVNIGLSSYRSKNIKDLFGGYLQKLIIPKRKVV